MLTECVFVIDIRRRLNLIKVGRVSKQSDLTPVAKRYYKIARGFLRTARRLDMENTSNRQRVEEAYKLIDSGEVINDRVNAITATFLKSQLRLQQLSGRGRRFTNEDKLFALMLLKQSPKCYKLLRMIFALPSRTTLLQLLRKVTFRCGLNTHVSARLSAAAAEMDPLDRCCSLIFDEMLIQPGLTYTQR